MNLSSFLTRTMVSAKLTASNKQEAIETVVDTLCSRRGLKARREILDAILSRENQLTTAIGNGVAIPHARIERLREPVLFVATLQSGIDFGAKEPVDIIFLFITPVDASNTHLISATTRRRLITRADD